MLRILAGASLLMLLLSAAAVAGDDIVGYRTQDNWWVLGDDIDDVDLDGFAEVPDPSRGWETYVDLRRMIQFDGTDRIITGALMFHRAELAAIFIVVPTEEMTFRQLHKYYKGRVGGCSKLINEWDHKNWVDDDGDFLMLVRSDDEYYGESTVVAYLNQDAMEYFAGISIPDWMWDVFETWDM